MFLLNIYFRFFISFKLGIQFQWSTGYIDYLYSFLLQQSKELSLNPAYMVLNFIITSRHFFLILHISGFYTQSTSVINV